LHTPRNGLISLSDDNNRNAAIWSDHRWNVKWLDYTTRLRTFNHDIGTHPIGSCKFQHAFGLTASDRYRTFPLLFNTYPDV